jgi:N6-adenosine-specific RNA methylase IME4
MKLNRDVLQKLPFALRVEIEENAQRKPLTQSELAAEQRRILAELRKHKTPGARNDLKTTPAKDFAQVEAKRATKIVGELFNESDRQVEKRFAIVDAAEAEPEKFGKLLADMDRTGRVNGVYRRLKIARQAELIRAEPPPMPRRGPYRVIVADPKWENKNRGDDSSRLGMVPYPTMTVAEICATDVASIAREDCILWLWVTNYYMRDGYEVLDAWGFERRTILTWNKPHHSGTGDWLFGQTEHAIMAIRGKPVVTLTNQSTRLDAPVRAHSQKPTEFYDLVEKLCPAPRYADLFSRYQHNEKWDCHGDEAPNQTAARRNPRKHEENVR